MNFKIKIVGNYEKVKDFIPEGGLQDRFTYLYAISFENKTLKAGKTKNPFRRIKEHVDNALNYGSNKAKDVIIAGPYSKDSEKCLLESVSKFHKNIQGEWFEFTDEIDILVKHFPES